VQATCHAPTAQQVFQEIYRVLKPGQSFACYEWVYTDKFDKSNPEHIHYMDALMHGDALPRMSTQAEVLAAMSQVSLSSNTSSMLAVPSIKLAPGIRIVSHLLPMLTFAY
jgi:sterol 24-C-methyltransferase